MVNCQLLIVNCQLLIVNCQLLIVNEKLHFDKSKCFSGKGLDSLFDFTAFDKFILLMNVIFQCF